MLFVFPQGGGKVIQRNAFKILVFGRAILRDKQVGVINGTAGIGIFDLHVVGSRCRKVSFNPGKYIIQCLAQNAVEGKGNLVGVLNNRCFAIQNRNFGVRWRKGIGQSTENKTREHENK